MKTVRLKKIIGWVLAIIGAITLHSFLVSRSSTKEVVDGYVIAILITSFCVFVIRLILSEE